MPWTKKIPFKVDIAGIIEIMGASLYSKSDTPVRELIQNAHDAVIRRRKRDLKYQGKIAIFQNAQEHTLTIQDDGIGLDAEDAEAYLGTLGAGITGLIKKGQVLPAHGDISGDAEGLIGMFGIGLFSGFMLAERLVVESRRVDLAEPIRWEAGPGTEIILSSGDRESIGTTITLHLKPEFHVFAEDAEMLEETIKEYADFLAVPIFLNESKARVNVINVAWFDPSPEEESIELELEGYFSETPLDVIPIRIEKPVSIAGALYVTPQRVPGFSSDPVVTVSVRRMVISRKIQGLLPPWASFLRGVLELNDCSPTASREDLVRDMTFAQVIAVLEQKLFEHFERVALEDPAKIEALLQWHRYTLAGSALHEPRLRNLLRKIYKFATSKGQMTFDEIVDASPADPLVELDAERVIWYNSDRRQERWINAIFMAHDVPCVHALRNFEEQLLAAFTADSNVGGEVTDFRPASPSSDHFTTSILGVRDLEEAPAEWQDFLSGTDARIMVASFRAEQPVMAFLNERYELHRTMDELKQQGTIPPGFQRMIDAHFQETSPSRNEVLLNRNHRLVGRALTQKTSGPLASVLRLLTINALSTAGATIPTNVQRQQVDDLDWIAEALWGKNP